MTMPAVDTSRSESSTSPGVERFTAVQMPIEEPVDDLDDAVEKLNTCSTTDLRRARQHHRRALESLRNGGYHALSDETRDQLVDHLQNNLRALNRALESTSENQQQTSSGDDSIISRLRDAFHAVW